MSITLKQMEEGLALTRLNRGGSGETAVADGYTSDLLSDVMANAPEDSVLVTIQGHKNSVAVAGLAGIRGIILCNGRKAPEDMIEAANGEEIALFTTNDNQFTVSYRLGLLLRSGE